VSITPKINNTKIPPTYTSTCVIAIKSAPANTYKAAIPKNVNNKLNAAYKTFFDHKTTLAERIVRIMNAMKIY
jgi:hypothetical protein